MNSFKNPLVPLISDPVNLDRPIQELQVALSAGLPWLEKSFGRAFDAVKKIEILAGFNKPVTFPQVWQGLGKDLLEVLPNDNLSSQSFFKVQEPVDVLEYTPNRYSLMRANVSVIFWYNLLRIDDSVTYNFSELLKGQAQRVITNATLSDSSVEIVKIWDSVASVFRGYDLTQLKDQELVYPWGGFRIEMLITYQENCPDVSFPAP